MSAGQVTLTRGARVFSITFDPEVRAETLETGLKVGPRRVVTLSVQTRNYLKYVFSF